MNFLDYFTNGLSNTLKFKNRANFSFKGEAIPVFTNTTIDTWFIGDFSSADYEIVAEYGAADVEHINVKVTAHHQQVSITTYARTNTGRDLVQITATSPDNSKVLITANPFFGSDGVTALSGIKVTFKATYSERLYPAAAVTAGGESSSLGGEAGTNLNWSGTNLPTGSIQLNDSGSIVISNIGSVVVGGQSTLASTFILDKLNIATDSSISATTANNNSISFNLNSINSLSVTTSFTAAPTTTGTLNNVAIGSTVPIYATFSSLTASGNLSLNDPTGMTLSPTGTGTTILASGATGTINNLTVGASIPNTGVFTSLTANNSITLTSANQNVSITPTAGFAVTSSVLGSVNNMQIGNITPAPGKFTSITINSPQLTGKSLITRSQLQSSLFLGAVAL